jgi:formamidopyrimidine-DNA glycosylase
VLNPFLVRTAVPPLASAEGKRVEAVERLAKRLVLVLEDDLFLVIHLMIAGD